MHFTLRQLHAMYTNHVFLTLYCAVTAICILIGPFRTGETLSLPWRALYWAIANFMSFNLSGLIVAFVKENQKLKFVPLALRIIVSGCLIGATIALGMFMLNAIFWPGEPKLPSYWALCAIAIPISYIIEIVVIAIVKYSDGKQTKLPDDLSERHEGANKEVTFFKRLPLHLGRDLLSVSVQDHYVEAVTSRGRHLVLMRFSDALDELENIHGVHIHRSHWVNCDAINSVVKRDGKMMVQLNDDRILPVSRSKMPQVRSVLNL